MFTFGTDPEFILEKNGKVISAISILKGTKEERQQIEDCFFYYDNVLGECCVPPSASSDEAVANIGKCLKIFSELVKPAQLVIRASQVYPKSELKHKEALKIACTPEFCAYDIEEAKQDANLFEKVDLRSAGGHVHVGSEHLFDENSKLIAIRLLDLFLGIPALLIDRDPTAQERKKLYGKAGRFRTPSYGVEYRSISNFWLASPNLVRLVYDICEFVVNFIKDGRDKELWFIDEERLQSVEAWSDRSFKPSQCHKCIGYDVDLLRKILDTGDRKGAADFLDLAFKYIPEDLKYRINGEIVFASYNMYKEWNL